MRFLRGLLALGLGCSPSSPAAGDGDSTTTTTTTTTTNGTWSAESTEDGATSDKVDLPSARLPTFSQYIVSDIDCGILELVDHDGDGNTELLAFSPQPQGLPWDGAQIVFLLAGQARPMSVVSTRELESTWRVAAADVDGDDRDDVVLSGARFAGTTQLAFTAALRANEIADSDPLSDTPWNPPADYADRAAPLPGGGDVLRSSGDRVEVLRWSQESSTLEVVEGSALVLPVRATDVAVVELGPTAATRAILPSTDSTLVLAQETPTTFVLQDAALPFGGLARVRTVDVDGDQRRDVLGLTWEPARAVVLVVPGDGSLGLTSEVPLDLEVVDTHAWPRIDAVDLDGDGFADLVLFDDAGLRFHRGNGDGTFIEIGFLLDDPDIHAVIGADFDADGRSDLAACRGSELLLMYGEP